MSPEMQMIAQCGIGTLVLFLWVRYSTAQIKDMQAKHEKRETELQLEAKDREESLNKKLDKRDAQNVEMLTNSVSMLERATMAIVQNSAMYGQVKEAVGKLEAGVEHLQIAVEKLEEKILK